ncbi:MAG TPA: hypothetical protein VII47_10350 [Actinomycetota bacterium]
MNPNPDASAPAPADPSAGLTRTLSRIVIVLGREATLDPAPLIAAAWRRHLKLMILVLGLPLTPSQQHVCEAGLEAAGRGLLELEERVVLDPRRVAGLVEDSDHVVFAVSPEERDELGWE